MTAFKNSRLYTNSKSAKIGKRGDTASLQKWGKKRAAEGTVERLSLKHWIKQSQRSSKSGWSLCCKSEVWTVFDDSESNENQVRGIISVQWKSSRPPVENIFFHTCILEAKHLYTSSALLRVRWCQILILALLYCCCFWFCLLLFCFWSNVSVLFVCTWTLLIRLITNCYMIAYCVIHTVAFGHLDVNQKT